MTAVVGSASYCTMGATCSKGQGRAVDPIVAGVAFDEMQVDDSAADCIPAGYRAKRRQAVSIEFRHTPRSANIVNTGRVCCKWLFRFGLFCFLQHMPIRLSRLPNVWPAPGPNKVFAAVYLLHICCLLAVSV